MRILVVDDDPIVFHGISRVLSPDSHEVLSASTAAEGLSILERSIVELIFLDLLLPDISGLAFARTMAASSPRMPALVLVTGLCTAATLSSAFAAGFFDCLAKPFGGKDVRNMVRRTEKRGKQPVDTAHWEQPVLVFGEHSWVAYSDDGITAKVGIQPRFLATIDEPTAILRTQTNIFLEQGGFFLEILDANGCRTTVRSPISGDIREWNPDISRHPRRLLNNSASITDAWCAIISPADRSADQRHLVEYPPGIAGRKKD